MKKTILSSFITFLSICANAQWNNIPGPTYTITVSYGEYGGTQWASFNNTQTQESSSWNSSSTSNQYPYSYYSTKYSECMTPAEGGVQTTEDYDNDGNPDNYTCTKNFTISTGIAYTTGNVGIGTTLVPSQTKLIVKESGSSASSWRGRIVAGGDNVVFVAGEYQNKVLVGGHNAALNQWADVVMQTGGGNVGIGTSSPSSSAKLDVVGKIKITDGTQGAGKVLVSDANGLATWTNINQSQWATNGSNISYTTGSVGIGTATPSSSAKLDVAGKIKIADGTQGSGKLLVSDASGLASWVGGLTINSAGEVGIGMSPSPGYKLSVNGSVGFSNVVSNSIETSSLYTGSFKFENGTQGLGKVLMSDANGNANWSTLPAGSQWVTSGSNISYTAGNVQIGVQKTTATDYKLSVDGKIYCKEIRVTLNNSSNWADFVFKKDYKLASLEEVENHILKNGHLENVPSADEVASAGYDVTKMDANLLRKIEELTLYIISQEKRIKQLENEK